MLATATKRKKFAQMSSQYSGSGRNIQNNTGNILEEDFNLVNVYKHCSNLTRMQKNMCGLSFLHLNIGTVETMFSSVQTLVVETKLSSVQTLVVEAK